MLASILPPGETSIDVSEIIGDARNIAIVAEGGVIIFLWQEPSFYEACGGFAAPFRGAHELGATLAAYRHLFTQSDCLKIFMRTPMLSPSADRINALVGATKQFDRRALWPTIAGPVDVSFWTLTYDDWVRTTPDLAASGQAFFDRLYAERARLGHEQLQPTDRDECLLLHIGAFAEMLAAGQLEKAVILYNRWARFAYLPMVSLIAHNPAMIDTGDTLLHITADTFKAIRCK